MACDHPGLSAPPLTPLAAAVLHVPAPERALVIGCGDGEAALFLAREFPSARVRGVDSSADRVQAATVRVGLDREGRIAFKHGSPRALPYPDGFFGLVTQLDGRPRLAEIARVLGSDGRLILARSRPLRVAAEARERLLRARLARHGLVPIRSERAGNGNFLVARFLDRG
jgi:ubiquinone/menaquinone biosynthesis C-methylase UbiE